MQDNEMIHVVLAVYDPTGTYAQYAGVVMTSIFENTRSSVTVHVLHDDTLTEDNRRKFLRTAEKYHQGVDLVDVSSYRDNIDKETADFFKDGLTVGTLYRLAIPELLKLDKVIYLDCDIIVNLDIRELWNEGSFMDGGGGQRYTRCGQR